jgi:hypothetical protein
MGPPEGARKSGAPTQRGVVAGEPCGRRPKLGVYIIIPPTGDFLGCAKGRS